MSALLDSSVLIAALVPSEDRHAQCMALLMRGGHVAYAHAFLETFSTLTGGKLGRKVDADLATRLLNETVLPRVQLIELSGGEILAALQAARKHGVRGGAVYDFMHLVATRKAGVTLLCTLNLHDFQGLVRPGYPIIQLP